MSFRIVLASTSPRRAALCRQLGLHFGLAAADIDEPERLPDESPGDWVQRSAAAKIEAVAPRFSDALILGADTAVLVDDTVLGKPLDEDDAIGMLELLSGRTHEVLTGVALRTSRLQNAACEKTDVTFRELTRAEIEAYVRTGEPGDKAGAYGIQGRGGLFVARIEGCYFNVVGLPLARVGKMLEDVGVLVHECW